MNNIKIYIILIFFNIFILSCNYNNSADLNSIKTESLKDRADNIINPPKNIEKISSLSPAATEIIISLGLYNKITAVDSVSKEILEKNKIDTSNMLIFDMLNPDPEKIIYIKPDILFVNTFSVFGGKNSLDSIKSSDICVAVIPNSYTIKSIEDDISFIGSVLNKSDAASNIINIMDINIEKIKSIGSTITNKKKIYFEIAALPNLYTFGTNVYLDDMINIIGAVNIFSNRNSWITASEENIIFSNPDIIFTSVHYINNPADEILSRESWKNINAVKNKDVYYLISASLPTHNIIYALFDMAKYVYPNEYKYAEIIRN